MLDGHGGVTMKDDLRSPASESTIVSVLTIRDAARSVHSGRYECAPDNIRPASINLHVIKGT